MSGAQGVGTPGVGTLVRDILIFAAVVLAAWLASRALGRQARVAAGGQGFTLLGALSLGQGRQVCAVHIAGRVLILGLGDKTVSLLEAISDPEQVRQLVPPAAQGGGGASGAFGQKLAQALARRLRGGGGPDA